MMTCKNGLKKRRNHAVMGERFIFIYFLGGKVGLFRFFFVPLRGSDEFININVTGFAGRHFPQPTKERL